MYSLKIKNLYKISHIDFYESDTFTNKKNLLHLDSHFILIKDLMTDEYVDTSIKLILNKVTSYFNISIR